MSPRPRLIVNNSYQPTAAGSAGMEMSVSKEALVACGFLAAGLAIALTAIAVSHSVAAGASIGLYDPGEIPVYVWTQP